jgi:hypothetical protein
MQISEQISALSTTYATGYALPSAVSLMMNHKFGPMEIDFG